MKYIADTMKMVGTYKFTIKDAKTGRVKRTYVYKNLIPTVGRAAVAAAIAGNAASLAAVQMNYTALGTNTTAPANGDTTLGTETYRKAIASMSSSNNIAYATAFYNATETSGTFREAGVFINGTAAANSGTLFSRVAINITKTTSETLTLDYTLTIV